MLPLRQIVGTLNSQKSLYGLCVWIAATMAGAAASAQEVGVSPLSRPERTNFEETSLYEDVVVFFDELQFQTPLMRLTTFGKTNEGRDLPLAVIANPPVGTAREALASEKPIVFVMANIHAGEVEGKEALQHVARRLVSGDLRPLSDKLIILFAPIYNADGNEKTSATGRSRQNGPIGPVGQRPNAQGFDLNRDYMKLEAPETRALVALFNEWDPHITVDLHTTNGSYHAYHLTYSIPLNPSIDFRLASYHRDKMMPEIAKSMLDKHKFRTYYYGNFADASRRGGGPRASGAGDGGGRRGRRGARGGGGDETRGERGGQGAEAGSPRGEQGVQGGANSPANTETAAQQPSPSGPPLRQWRAFSHLPRVGQNYVGFRNRLTILSEAYSYVDFKGRIDVTAAFVEEIMRYAIEHADEIQTLTRQIDDDLVRQTMREGPPKIGVAYEQRPLPEPVEILEGKVSDVLNPRTERNMTAMVPDAVTPVRMWDYGIFVATRDVAPAYAYVFPPEEGLRVVIEKLRAHGILVEELTRPLKAEALAFHIARVTTAARPFEQHREVSLAGAFEAEQAEFPAGTIVVRTAQPLGRLAAYLLEPESDDSLATWNFLDDYLGEGRIYPIRKLMRPMSLPSRVLATTP